VASDKAGATLLYLCARLHQGTPEAAALTGQLRNDAFYRRIRQHPLLSDPHSSAHAEFAAPVETTQVGPNTRYPALTTPPMDERGAIVEYEILDLDRHMDSSEMTPSGAF
jgi:hypothetical protein